MLVWEWADAHRILPKKSSSEGGPYRTSRTPFLKEIMECLSPSNPCETVTFMKCTQIGATELGNNWIGYVIDHSPGPAMVVQPTDGMAQKWSKQRLAPMVSSTPSLRDKVKDPRARDSVNTILMKEFPAGVLVITGANSPIGLRMMPARFLFQDEIDAYPMDAGGEGEPSQLANERTETFARKKIFYTSTGKDKESSRIEPKYEESDQRKYYVPCPHCKEKQVLKWGNLDFDSRDLSKPVTYICDHCGALIEEHHKTWMLENGEWRAEKPGPGRDPGFWINALYSPIGWKSWEKCVKQFLKAKRAPDNRLLKVFVNTVLAETWEEQGESVNGDTLLARKEQWGKLIPNDIVVITSGTDVQKDRLEMEIVGWGPGGESWSLDYIVIPGDPKLDDVFKKHDAHLERTFKRYDGVELRIISGFMDSGGHWTDRVYEYCGARQMRRFYASKGASTAGKPIVSRPKKPSNRYGAIIMIVGTDQCKEIIYSNLAKGEPGPGFYHFPIQYPSSPHWPDEEHFNGITAEKVVTRYRFGRPIRVWVRKSSRLANEPLDCRVYAYAAMVQLNVDWEKLAENLKPEEPEKPTPPPPKDKRKRKPGFVNRWRR